MHRPIALLILLVCALASCKDNSGGHHHASEHPSGHDHHSEGHGHGETPTVSVTGWSDSYELFAEHTAGRAGEEMSFLLHLTELGNFQALSQKRVRLAIDGGASLPPVQAKEQAPGIFTAVLTPPTAGAYQASVSVGEDTITFDLTVSAEGIQPGGQDEDDTGLVEFLKEQQWSVPFSTDFAQKGSLVASVEVSGRIQTPPGGSAEVSAPIPGRLLAPKDGLPWPGASVKKGQVLAELQPAPSSPEQGARASLAVAEAQARAAAAKSELERAQRLLRDDAIAKRDAEAAEREHRVAQEAVRAALRAQRLYSGATGTSGQGAWRLTAPISGTLVSVHGTPGATVSPGEPLFQIVDADELWILARVPEQDVVRLRNDRDASFQLTGQDTWQPIRITGDDATASLITIGKVVDARSRTVDVLYSLHEPDASLRVGGLVQVSLPAGKEFTGLVVPRSALVQKSGREVVFVQVDGEHFEERSVQVSASAGSRVGIVGDLELGERIVTRGAHLVHLAESAGGPPSHGHIH